MNKFKSEIIFESAYEKKSYEGFCRKSKKLDYGIEQLQYEIKNTDIAKKIGREVGNYICLNFDELLFFDKNAKLYITKKIKSALKLLLKINKLSVKKVLVVGLGNKKFACDSLGSRVVEKLIITKPYLDKNLFDKNEMIEIFALCPGVYGTTGIDSSEVIGAICKSISPDLVIAVDSLVATKTKTLSRSIQISDTKLMPGGGVGNNRQEISFEILKTKVLAIGVPLVVRMEQDKNLIVALKDVEEQVGCLSKIIATAINKTFINLSEKKYQELTN